VILEGIFLFNRHIASSKFVLFMQRPGRVAESDYHITRTEITSWREESIGNSKHHWKWRCQCRRYFTHLYSVLLIICYQSVMT